jgi:hypothetical protein
MEEVRRWSSFLSKVGGTLTLKWESKSGPAKAKADEADEGAKFVEKEFGSSAPSSLFVGTDVSGTMNSLMSFLGGCLRSLKKSFRSTKGRIRPVPKGSRSVKMSRLLLVWVWDGLLLLLLPLLIAPVVSGMKFYVKKMKSLVLVLA